MTDTIANEILVLERRRFDAMIAADGAELDRLLHRDLRYTHSSGAVDTKASYTKGVLDKLWDYQKITASDQSVSVYGDTALVHCRLEIDVSVQGTPRRVESRALAVWIKDDGRWQVVAVHSTPQPKA